VNKKMVFSILLILVVFAVIAMVADPGPYDDYAAAITDLIDDLAPIVLSVVGAAIGLAAGILVVRMGYRWVKRFLGGA